MKQKSFSILLVLLMSMAANVALAYDAQIDGIYYSFSGDKAIVSYQKMQQGNYSSDYSGILVIPETVAHNGKTYSVSGIGDHAFENSSNLTSVTIPNSVITIGQSAFGRCSSLTSITIPKGVTSIKDYTFDGCIALTNIDLPENMESIGIYAFRECRGITIIDIPNNVTSIGMCAFWGCSGLISLSISSNLKNIEYSCFMGCSSLTSITIPNGVTSIGEQAFYGCNGLNFIELPNSITSIGYSAFKNCTSLVSIAIPDNVKRIENSVFFGCSSLARIIFPKGLIYIGNNAFESCRSLNSITIPEEVTSIGDFAFNCCSSLSSVIIGNSVRSIGSRAFNNCASMTSVTIGSAVASINKQAFSSCSGLQKVIVPDISAWCGINFMSMDSNPLYYAHHLYSDDNIEIKDLVVPSGVSCIEAYAFSGCEGLTSVTIPCSVTSIVSSSFSGCSNLKSIHIKDIKAWCESSFGIRFPNTYNLYINNQDIHKLTIPQDVTNIGAYAFANCNNITSVIIPKGVTSIGNSSFQNCKNITYIIIPNQLTSIGERTFYNCSGLKDVYCFAEILPATSSTAFEKSSIGSATLHVPVGFSDLYKNTLPWSGFKEIVEIDEKCASPTIHYSNGELSFNCETEGADFVAEITDTDIKKYYSAKISLCATYNISVYATKDGYENSDTIQATLCWVGAEPKADGTKEAEDEIKEVKAMPILIQSNNNVLNVSGAPEGAPISVYDMDGRQLANSTAVNGTTRVSVTTTAPIVIVKILNKTVKVKVE